MRHRATALLAGVLLVTLTGCSARRIHSGVWMLWVVLLVALVGAFLVLGAIWYGSRRRLPRTANFEIYREQS